MKNKNLTGLATPEQIEQWKKEYGDIYECRFDDSVCYLTTPDRKTMAYVATLGNQPIRANEVLIDNCWLGGDESIKTDDAKFFGLSAKLDQLLKIKDAELTKL